MAHDEIEEKTSKEMVGGVDFGVRLVLLLQLVLGSLLLAEWSLRGRAVPNAGRRYIRGYAVLR